MMEKAGYLQRTGCRALDSDGRFHEVIDLHICGARYAVRRSDLERRSPAAPWYRLRNLPATGNITLG